MLCMKAFRSVERLSGWEFYRPKLDEIMVGFNQVLQMPNAYDYIFIIFNL